MAGSFTTPSPSSKSHTGFKGPKKGSGGFAGHKSTYPNTGTFASTSIPKIRKSR